MKQLTKTEMARVIVQALYNLPHLPEPTNPNVQRAARNTTAILQDQYKMALAVLDSVRVRDAERKLGQTENAS